MAHSICVLCWSTFMTKTIWETMYWRGLNCIEKCHSHCVKALRITNIYQLEAQGWKRSWCVSYQQGITSDITEMQPRDNLNRNCSVRCKYFCSKITTPRGLEYTRSFAANTQSCISCSRAPCSSPADTHLLTAKAFPPVKPVFGLKYE